MMKPKKTITIKYTLRYAFHVYLSYLLALGFLVVKGNKVIADGSIIVIFFLITYFVGAFHLMRVLPGIVEWHSIYNTLDNVVSTKLRLFFFWPITFGKLLFSLFVNSVL